MITPQVCASSLHEAVRKEVLKRIQNGTYPLGLPIPSAATFGREFGVSQITIKRALRDLQAIGAVTAVAGKGTFVKEQSRSLIEFNASLGPWENVCIRPLSITREAISDTTLREFNPPGKAMLCVRKTIFFFRATATRLRLRLSFIGY